jgi:Dolichyl-phosphate-mannose-protein mannosyltransferase
MLIFLPLISLAFFLLILSQSYCGRSSVLYSALSWGVTVAMLTETLSLLKALTFPWIVTAWILIDLALAIFYFRMPNKSKIFDFNLTGEFDLLSKLSVGEVIFIVIIVGFIAFVAPPNTWDSMNYHMSRVVHWMQAGSVAHYPTSYEPQLYQNPLAEFLILHLQVLSGGDYFANAVQWLSLIGCTIGVSLIASQVGASLPAQFLSALIAATVPMGILQASSAKNDYLLSLWLVCLVHSVLLLFKEKLNLGNTLKVSASLGLALLTKGTAYVYVFPFMLGFFLIAVRQLKGKSWQPFLTVAAVSLPLNLGHFFRNFDLYGSFLGPLKESLDSPSYRNEVLGLFTLLSNVLRNIGSNLGTPVSFINQKIYGLINRIHSLMGLDINDPRTTFTGEFYIPGGIGTIGFYANEDNASSTIHCLLILVSIVIFLSQHKFRTNKPLLTYLSLTTATFLVFCFLIKWQIWVTRLHLPVFILFSAFVGIILVESLNRRVVSLIAVVLILSSLPWLSLNRYRPLLGSNNIIQTSRIEQYFIRQPELREPYLGAAKFMASKSCSNIGLDLKDPYEYPFWIATQTVTRQNVRIEHVNVTGLSASFANQKYYQSFNPCAIFYLASNKNKHLPQTVEAKKKTYGLTWSSHRVGVFLSNPVPNSGKIQPGASSTQKKLFTPGESYREPQPEKSPRSLSNSDTLPSR